MRTSILGKKYDEINTSNSEKIKDFINVLTGTIECCIMIGETLPICAQYDREYVKLWSTHYVEVTKALSDVGVSGRFEFSEVLGHYFLVTELK